jgi:DNA invertase Pin-like site-specific DNA recombinase
VRLVAYLRVSTDRQAEEGLGLEVQEQAIRSWAKGEGHRVVLWCSDEGVSGSNGLEDRVALSDALQALRDRRAVGLLVYRLDRLARDLMIQEQLLAEIRRMNAKVFSTSKGEDAYLVDDPDDPSRRFIRQVLGAVSEYERAMISLRLRSGRRRKAATGGFAYGSPPMGFRAEGRELVPDEGERAAVAKIVALRSEGRSLRAIAEVLDREGIVSKRGGRWHPQTVRRVLERGETADDNGRPL